MIDLLCFEAKEGLGGGWPDRFWRVYRAVNLRRIARVGRTACGRLALPQSYVAQLPADLPIVPLETCDDRQRAFDDTERFLDGWYDPPDLDYEGFDLGQIVRYKVAVYAGGLHRAVRAVDVAERLLTETAAQSVMVVDGVPYLERGLVALAQAQGRRARYLWPGLFRAPLVAAYDALQFRVDYRPDEVTLLGVAPPAASPTLAPRPTRWPGLSFTITCGSWWRCSASCVSVATRRPSCCPARRDAGPRSRRCRTGPRWSGSRTC